MKGANQARFACLHQAQKTQQGNVGTPVLKESEAQAFAEKKTIRKIYFTIQK